MQQILSLVNIGIEKQSLSDQRIVRLINGKSLICIIVTLFSEVYVLSFAGFFLSGFITSVVTTLFFITVIYLNYLGKVYLNKWILVAYVNVTLVWIYFALHYSTGILSLYFAAFPLYIALFQSKKIIVPISIITLGLMLSIFNLQDSASYQPIMIFTEEEMKPVKITFMIAGAGLTYLITLFLKGNLQDHQLRLEQALEEKNILLREVHHRVKNNLQVIYSLFNYQKRRLDSTDENSYKIIQTAQDRIRSMILVHQELYKEHNINYISTVGYINELVAHLEQIHQSPDKDIQLHLNIERIKLPLEKAIPLGLIINECLSNAFKHAFIEKKGGDIYVNFTEKENEITLAIKDNGGQKAIVEKPKQPGIGLELIKGMADQLGARFKLDRTNGFSYIITL